MRRGSSEFLYQLATLFVAAMVVHAVYVLVIRPRADEVLAERQAQMQINPEAVQERSVVVIVRDFEQEACFILMLWAMAMMGYKGVQTVRERRFLDLDLVGVGDGTKILPEDAREYAREPAGHAEGSAGGAAAPSAPDSPAAFLGDPQHPGRLFDGAQSV